LTKKNDFITTGKNPFLIMEQIVKFIGIIHSSLKKLDDCPKLETENAPEATISILAEFVERIRNIKAALEMS